MNPRTRLAIRLSLSIVFGMAVAWLPFSMIVGGHWKSQFDSPQRRTQSSLRIIDRTLKAYRDERGDYPKDFGELKLIDSDAEDGWKRAWIYSLPDGKPLVESLGRDGKRGGRGADADLSDRDPRPAQARASWWKNVSEPVALPMVLASLGCGLLTATVFFVGLAKETFEPKTWPRLLISSLATLALAAFGALFIAILHVPSGH